MTQSDKENLERKLNHILSLVDMICEQYAHILCSERAALLLSLYIAVKQASKNVGIVRGYLTRYILDIFHVDYDEYARNLTIALEKLVQFAGAPMVVNIDDSTKPIIGTDNILNYEDSTYDLKVSGKLTRISYVRSNLIDNATYLYEQIEDYMQLIIDDLKGIADDFYWLKDNPDELKHLYNDLHEMYLKDQGEEDIQDIEDDLERFFQRNGFTVDSIDRLIYKKKEEDIITYELMEGTLPAYTMLVKRKELSWEDVKKHFKNMLCLASLKDAMQKMKDGVDMPQYHIKKGDIVVINLGKYIETEINNYYNR